jgi:hypothetical protein
MPRLIISLVLVSILAAGCSLKKTSGLETDSNGANDAKRRPDLPKVVNNESRVVIKDAFSLEAPANWLEGASIPGVSLMMVNNSEEISSPAAKKINFRSYFSVSYDQLKEKTLAEYTRWLKEEDLTRLISGISFRDEETITLDGRTAAVFKADFKQQGVDFTLLMFIIASGEQDVWLVSLNTLAESFAGYEDLFYEIAGSFRVK